MRRLVVPLILVALAVALLFVLRERKRQFIAAQVTLLQSADSEEATQARKRLQRVGGPAVRSVCALLEHQDDWVRARAAHTLANIGHPAACGPLMKAAKRGDFPAADALPFMKHPRAAEARAWAYCRLADTRAEQLERHLPGGGAPPTAPWTWRYPPAAMFQPAGSARIDWPGGYSRDDHPWACITREPSAPDSFYQRALEKCPSPEAFIGRARLSVLCGDNAEAAKLYAEALQVAPGNEAAAAGRAEAERLAALRRRMRAVSGRTKAIDGPLRGPPRKHLSWPSHLALARVLSHDTWRDGDARYYVGIMGTHWGLALCHVVPKLLLYRSHDDDIEQIGNALPVFSMGEFAKTYYAPRAYAGLLPLGAEQPAAVVAIRPLAIWRVSPRSYGLSLYSVTPRGLVKSLEAGSAFMPWFGDLDEDGDAEIVTWQCPSCDGHPPYRVPWPTVRTLVDARYQIDAQPFPQLFPHVARVLGEREERYPQDPNIADYLGRAHEITGKTDLAIAAYRRAEEKYRAKAAIIAAKGQEYRARRHREAADAVEQRLLRIEAEGGGD